MSAKQDLFEQINSHYVSFFVDNHNGTTKVSQTRARNIGEIKKLVTSYKKSISV